MDHADTYLMIIPVPMGKIEPADVYPLQEQLLENLAVTGRGTQSSDQLRMRSLLADQIDFLSRFNGKLVFR